MKNLKLITTLVLAFAFLLAQVGNVAAAPLALDSTLMGTVKSIVVEKDAATGDITVLVELEDAQGATQTVRISEATAITLGLLQLDSSNQPILDPVTGLPAPVVLDPNSPLSVTIASGDIITDEADVHPISAILAKFFDVDASIIDGFHTEDGFGFGVIAQALWIANGDTDITKDILVAKQEKDFKTFFENHPEYALDDGTVPTNWGQFKKALSEKKENLGSIVSGHAEQDENLSTQSVNEHGKGKGPGNGKGLGKGHHHP